MQVTAVDDKFKYNTPEADDANTPDSSGSTDNADFSLSATLGMVANGKSKAGENRSLTGKAKGISKDAVKAGEEFKQNVTKGQQEVNEFKAFNAQQQRVMDRMLEEIDALYVGIDAENIELENIQASIPPTGPLKTPGPGSSDDGSEVPADPTTDDSTTEAETLTTSIQTKQASAFGLIANYTRTSKNVELRKLRSQNRVSSYHKTAKKSAAKQAEANSTADKILKISKTTSTVGSSITVAGIAGKAVGWAMNLIAPGSGAPIIAACSTVVCPTGELVFGAGKAGECGSNLALGNTNAALMAGGEAILSFVAFGSDLKTISTAKKAASAMEVTKTASKAQNFVKALDTTTKNASKVGKLINTYVKPAVKTAQVGELFTKVATKASSK